MNKRELIQMLENMPGDTMPVQIWDQDAKTYVPITYGVYYERDKTIQLYSDSHDKYGQ